MERTDVGGSRPLFEQTRTRVVIFGAFPLIFVPLALLFGIPNFIEWSAYPFLLLAVGVGVSHFFLTLTVYLDSRNLAYFAGDLRNRIIYFVVPGLILLAFALSAASEFRSRAPVAAAYVFGAIRFFDFFHVGRQSFGMLQIFKRSTADGLPGWLRSAENAFFVGMAVLQWQTFASGGRFAASTPYASLPAVALAMLATVICMHYLLAPVPGRWIALAYFVLQAISAATAVYRTHLYLIALTLHYVEYHVIMAPRWSRPSRPSDSPGHAFDRIARRPVLFYVVLAVVVVLFEARNHVPGGWSPTTTFFIHLFDGVFFVHYFVDAFIWKFRNPFYARTAAPLYMKPPDSVPRVRASRDLVGLASAIALGAALWLSGAAQAIEQRVVDPLRAENHVRWGIERAVAGDMTGARRHFTEALERVPNHAQAARLLQATQHPPAARTLPDR